MYQRKILFFLTKITIYYVVFKGCTENLQAQSTRKMKNDHNQKKRLKTELLWSVRGASGKTANIF